MSEKISFDIDSFSLTNDEVNQVNTSMLNLMLKVVDVMNKAEDRMDKLLASETNDLPAKIATIKAEAFDLIDEIIMNVI